VISIVLENFSEITIVLDKLKMENVVVACLQNCEANLPLMASEAGLKLWPPPITCDIQDVFLEQFQEQLLFFKKKNLMDYSGILWQIWFKI
jgi:hypothetical protein